MRKIKEILRLKFEAGLGQRQIARSCAIGKTTVAACLARFERSGLSWAQAQGLDEAALEQRLYPSAPALATEVRALPHSPTVHRELRGKGVTLALLWHEYKAAHPERFQYSWFVERLPTYGTCSESPSQYQGTARRICETSGGNNAKKTCGY